MYLHWLLGSLAFAIILLFLFSQNLFIRLIRQLLWALVHKLTPWSRAVAISRPEHATPALLTAMMQRRWPGVRVVSVSHTEIGGAQGSSGRVFRLNIEVAQPAPSV